GAPPGRASAHPRAVRRAVGDIAQVRVVAHRRAQRPRARSVVHDARGPVETAPRARRVLPGTRRATPTARRHARAIAARPGEPLRDDPAPRRSFMDEIRGPCRARPPLELPTLATRAPLDTRPAYRYSITHDPRPPEQVAGLAAPHPWQGDGAAPF